MTGCTSAVSCRDATSAIRSKRQSRLNALGCLHFGILIARRRSRVALFRRTLQV
jgi:hypothetical protein